MNSTVENTDILDCQLFSHQVFSDLRGDFSEIYKDSVLPKPIRQINYSNNFKNVFRGIHQTPYGKYVTCVSGKILDICVDLRVDSPTYLKVVIVKLSPDFMESLYIPPNCGHGFYTVTDSVVIYAQEDLYSDDTNTNHNYKKFDIDLPQLDQAIISQKDSL